MVVVVVVGPEAGTVVVGVDDGLLTVSAEPAMSSETVRPLRFGSGM